MAYNRDKIANSYFLPKPSVLRSIASLIDVTHSDCREFTEHLLARSDADAIRADWEAVGDSLWWAMRDYERRLKEQSVSE